VSNGVINYFKDKKAEMFKNIKSIDDDIEKYIKPLNRNNQQYGWYVYIEKCKADFGGVHIPLEKSKEDAIEFIKYLKNHLAKHLDAGSPLEPMLCNK
jgi:prefoldin subunit 5